MNQREREELIRDTFIEVALVGKNAFPKVKETLTRIGLIKNEGEKPILWQSCHILHKKGRYYIVHFKQLFLLDGKAGKTNLEKDDLLRTKVVANLLQKWGLVKIIKDPLKLEVDEIPLVYILSKKESTNYQLMQKYNIGKKIRQKGESNTKEVQNASRSNVN